MMYMMLFIIIHSHAGIGIFHEAYIFLIGKVLKSPLTPVWGNTVCRLGLWIPQANLANIYKGKYNSERNIIKYPETIDTHNQLSPW